MLPTNFGYIFYCILLFVYIWTANWQIEFVSPSSCSSTIWKCIYIYIYTEKCAMHCMASSFFISNKPNLAPMSHTSTRLGHAHFLGQVRWQFVSYFSTFSVFCFFFAFGFCFFFRFLYFLSCITCHSGARLAELIIFSKTLSRGISNSQSLPPI